jgi:hypothetical protein
MEKVLTFREHFKNIYSHLDMIETTLNTPPQCSRTFPSLNIPLILRKPTFMLAKSGIYDTIEMVILYKLDVSGGYT